MILKFISKDKIKFILLSLTVFFIFTIFLILSGYFEIDFLSDDYLDFISAENSNITQKFEGSISYHSNLHYRPLWFLSMNVLVYLNNILEISKDNFILYRIDNYVWLCLVTFTASFLLFRITRRLSLSLIFLVITLLYPNVLNDICWTIGKGSLMCGFFLFLSLYFTFSFIEKKSILKLSLTVLFFVLSLLTKEPAVVLPFVTILLIYISFGKAKLYESSQIIICELAVLILYSIFRLAVLSTDPVEIATTFQNPGIANTIGVILRAAISLTLPFDYLSIRYYISDFNVSLILYFVLIVIIFSKLLSILIKKKDSKNLLMLALIFFVSVIPNIIAGYFRPQLTLIPFLIFYLSLFIVINKISFDPGLLKIILPAIFIFLSVQSYYLIQDWKYASRESSEVINNLIQVNMDFNKKNIILGLPARYRQTHLLENAFAAYNYRKYGEFKIHDEFYDMVHTGALDSLSLNSDLKLKQMNAAESESEISGETQYFFIPGLNKNFIKSNDIEINLSGKNLFDKEKRMYVRKISDDTEIYYYIGRKFFKNGIK